MNIPPSPAGLSDHFFNVYLFRKQPALPRAALLHAPVQHAEDLKVAGKPPRSVVHEPWRHFSGHALDVEVGSQTFEDVDHEVEILIKPRPVERRRIGGIFLFHRRAFDDLKLVELDGTERQR